MPAVTAVLLHHSAWMQGQTSVLLVEGRKVLAVLPADNAVLIHHNSMDKGIDRFVFNTG